MKGRKRGGVNMYVFSLGKLSILCDVSVRYARGGKVFTRSMDDGGQANGVGDVLDALLSDDVRVGRHSV